MRTTLVLSGVPAYFLAISSDQFSSSMLLVVYGLAAIALLFINQFYGKKTAAWSYTAEKIQDCQIRIGRGSSNVLDNIKTCDRMYLQIYAENFSRNFKPDSPTYQIITALIIGGVILWLKFLQSGEKISDIYDVIFKIFP